MAAATAVVTLLFLTTIALLPTGSHCQTCDPASPVSCSGPPDLDESRSGISFPGDDASSVFTACSPPDSARSGIVECLAIDGTSDCRFWYINGVYDPDLRGHLISAPSSGNYTCLLVNSCGVTRFPFILPAIKPTLNSMGEEGGVTQIGAPRICLNSSSSGIDPSRISCLVSNIDDSISFTTTWSRNGQALPSLTDMSVIEVDTPGTYACTVRNICGPSSASSVVEVNPTIIKGNGTNASAMIDVGTDSCLGSGNLMIFCNIVGGVSVTRRWAKNSATLQGETSNKITVTPSAERDDMYMCNVVNSCSSDSATTTVIRQTEVDINAMIMAVSPIGTGCSRVMGNARFSSADLCPIVGETVTISCDAPAGVSYVITGPDNMRVTDQNLVVNMFMPANSGVYTCTATSRCGEATDMINITNIDLPPVVSNISDICLLADQTTNISCNATGLVVRYSWTRNRVVLSMMQDLIGVSHGTYTCTAVGVAENSTTSLRVLPNATSTLTVSSNFGSRCPRLLRPPPAGTDFCAFTRDIVTLRCNTNFPQVPAQIFPDGRSSLRVFNTIRTTDEGSYACRGMNDCGSFTDTKLIKVYEPARILIGKDLPVPEEGELVAQIGQTSEPICGRDGQKVTFHCCYGGTDPPVTEWVYVFPNGTEVPVNVNDTSINVTDTGSNLILSIEPFRERHVGKYRCNVVNIAGNTSSDIDITFKPEEDKQWSKGRWSGCSPDCHQGVRSRTVVCVTVSTRVVMSDEGCPSPKPPTQERCLDRGACSRWIPGPWSACSRSCGAGFRFRNVTCMTTYSNEVLPDSNCTTNGPSSFGRCNIHSCPCVEPDFCRHIKGSELCWRPSYLRMCCCTCGSPNSRRK